MSLVQGHIITIIEETEGWEDWKDVCIIWANGNIDLRTFVDMTHIDKFSEDEDDDTDRVYIDNLRKDAVVNWVLDYSRDHFHILNPNIVIGTFIN